MRLWDASIEQALLVGPVSVGDTMKRTFAVTAAMVTGHVPGAPAVLSTPSLIAMLEDTAADILRPLFAPGAASVGTWIGVRHRAPAIQGQDVVVHAAIAAVEGRRITFDVSAKVADRTIGDGQVTQTLIRAA